MKTSVAASGSASRSFPNLAAQIKRTHSIDWPVLAVDPGDTTGYCVFDQYLLTEAGQLVTPDARVEPLRELIERVFPSVVVVEEYRVYPSKASEHIHSNIPTARLIGALEYVCRLHSIPIYFQSAATAKGFATDDKLKAWGYWKTGQQHARDSIRHALHYILFGSTKVKHGS